MEVRLTCSHAEEYPRPDFNEMIEPIMSLLDKYPISFDNRCRICVDGVNRSFLRALKDRIPGEPVNYEQTIAYLNQHIEPTNFTLKSVIQDKFLIPVHFSNEHKNMLAHWKQMLEYNDGVVAIHPRFNKLSPH